MNNMKMLRFLPIAAFFIFFLMPFGNANPANYASYSNEYYYVIETLDSIKKAYNEKNSKGIIQLADFSASDKRKIKESLARTFLKNTPTKLTFNIKDHSQFFNKLTVNLDWAIEIDNDQIHEGKAKFIFRIKNKSAKLININGDSPFLNT